MIEFKKVTAAYDKKHGIFDLSFKVGKGEMIYLMGPTGSGKSTVFKTIYRDIQCLKGEVLVNQKNISKIKKRNIPYYRRSLGVIFQDYKLINDINVFENVALPLRIEGVSRKKINRQADKILNRVGIGKYMKAYPNELSGGEKQRVAIARSLIKDPLILLADEPTGNLDPNVSNTILDLLEDFVNEGKTIIMSTHDFLLVRPRMKRFIELSEGRRVK